MTLIDDPEEDPIVVPLESKTGRTYQRTDLGNTEYFLDTFAEMIRFDQSRKRWLLWRKHRWEPDHLRSAEEAASSAARKRLIDAIAMDPGQGQLPSGDIDPITRARQDAIKWAVQSESRLRIDNVIALAQRSSRISVQTAAGWDADAWVLGVPNGVVDLRTGKLRPGNRDDRITKQAGVLYDPNAQCPRWIKFLSEVLNDDADLVSFLRRALGYTLTGDLREDCWFGCHGSGSNGKSTLFKVLHQIFGDYGYVAPFSLVERGKGESRRDFDIAYLQCMRFVMASETREGGVWDEERLKRLSGGDPLHAEIKHGAEFEFLPSHKLWFMFNHQPRVRDHSVGFWRRVRMVPFARSFKGANADLTLDAKLASELSGVLTWLVQACIEWQQAGLTPPAAVQDASTRYEVDEDPLSEFVAKHLRLEGPGFVLAQAYGLYKEWCKTEHVDHPLGKSRFGTLLEPRGFIRSSRKDLIGFENGHIIRMCTCMKNPCIC